MKKLASIIIVLNLIFLNIGLSINSHYCGGELSKSSISLFHSYLSCGMDNMISECDNIPLVNSLKSIPCCLDLSEMVNIDIDYMFNKLSNLNFSLKLIYTIIPYKIVLDEANMSSRVSLDSHPPPKYNSKYRVLNQVFLI